MSGILVIFTICQLRQEASRCVPLFQFSSSSSSSSSLALLCLPSVKDEQIIVEISQSDGCPLLHAALLLLFIKYFPWRTHVSVMLGWYHLNYQHMSRDSDSQQIIVSNILQMKHVMSEQHDQSMIYVFLNVNDWILIICASHIQELKC